LERGDDRMAQIERFVLVLEVKAKSLFEVCESIVHRIALTRHINFKTARDEEISFVSDRGREFHAASIREGAVAEPWPNGPMSRTSGIQVVPVDICIKPVVRNARRHETPM